MRKVSLIGVVAVTMLIACSKLKESPDVYVPEPEPTVQPNTKFSTPDELLNSWIEPPSTFVKDADNAIDIVTPGGIRLHFPAKSLKLPDGTDASGSVEFTIQEYNSKFSMMMSGVTTLSSDGRFLESGGMLNVVATQNGKELAIKQDSVPDSSSVSFQFPITKELDNVEAFSGDKKPNEANKVSWERKPDWKVIKNLSGSFYRMMRINRLGFINLDRYMKKKYENCNIRIHLLDSCLAGSTQGILTPVKAIFLFKDQRSAAAIPFIKRNGFTLEFATQPKFGGPAGEPITIIIVGICNGVLKYKKVALNVIDDDNLVEIDTLETISEEDLKTLFSSFDN